MLFIPTNFAKEEYGVQNETGDNDGEKNNAENEENDFAEI